MKIKDLKLSQEAYLDGATYSAHATDKDGNEYVVVWEIISDLDSITDESEACDWESPISITKL